MNMSHNRREIQTDQPTCCFNACVGCGGQKAQSWLWQHLVDGRDFIPHDDFYTLLTHRDTGQHGWRRPSLLIQMWALTMYFSLIPQWMFRLHPAALSSGRWGFCMLIRALTRTCNMWKLYKTRQFSAEGTCVQTVSWMWWNILQCLCEWSVVTRDFISYECLCENV